MRSFSPPQTALLVLIALGALAFHAVKHSKTGHTSKAPPNHLSHDPTSFLPTSLHLDDLEPRKRLLLGIPISVNKISTDDLRLIPGISTTLARRIVKYRRQHGPFKRWSQLTDVYGLGPRTLEKLRPYLELNPKSEKITTGSGILELRD